MRFNLIVLFVALVAVVFPARSQSWTPVSALIPGGELNEIIIDQNGVLYGNQGLFVVRSTDEGASWEPVHAKNPITVEDLSVSYRLTTLVGPLNSKLLVLYPDNGRSVALYVSLNGGTTWTETQVPAEFHGRQLFVTGLRSGVALAFAYADTSAIVLKSEDGGRSWIIESSIPYLPVELHEASNGTAILYDIQGNLRRRSKDGVWTDMPSPQSGESVIDICMAASRFYVCDGASVHYTTNEGLSWITTTFEDSVESSGTRSIVGFPSGDAVFFNEVENNKTSVYHIRTADDIWVTKADSVRFRPQRAISFGQNRVMYPTTAGPIFSDTRGSEWEIRAKGLFLVPIWRFAIQGNTIVAISISGDIYRGVVGGTQWDLALDYPVATDGFPLLDVVGAAPSTFVIILSDGGVLRSVDDGYSWSMVPGTESTRHRWNICKRRNSNLVVSTSDVILESSDMGLTWNQIAEVSSPSGISESSDGQLYVAAGKSLYRVNNGSATLVHGISVDVGIALCAPNNSSVFGVVGAGYQAGIIEIATTLDSGKTWTTKQVEFPFGAEAGVLDAVLTDNGDLFASTLVSLIHMAPNGYITSSPTMELPSLSIGLRLDEQGNLYRSGASIIEKGVGLVSVREHSSQAPLQVSPIPSTGAVRIAGITSSGVTSINILDAVGARVAKTEVTPADGIVTLDVHALASGAYTVIIGESAQRVAMLISR